MLQSIADRGRALIQRREPSRERSAGLLELCEALLSGRGEASGVALARDILGRYEDLTIGPRIAFFEALATTFGSDGSNCSAGSISPPAAPRRWCACAKS
jgi:malonyl-CoA decarboxylase